MTENLDTLIQGFIILLVLFSGGMIFEIIKVWKR